MKIREFECCDQHVEIWRNAVYGTFFWVTGYSPERFHGSCYYFDTVDLAEQDARTQLALMAKEQKQ